MLSLVSALTICLSTGHAATNAPTPTVMVHYMPWFQIKEANGKWGWHWTMNHTDPTRFDHGRQDLASHYRPLLGMYDSGDEQLIDCHVLLMKFAGIDGLFIDWYGDADHFDYAVNNRNSQRTIEAAMKAGLKFALVYEDHTVIELLKAGKLSKEHAVADGHRLLDSIQDRWLRSPSYLKRDGKPVFLVFGPQFYKAADWTEIFRGLSPKPAFYTLHNTVGAAVGAFDWPLPQKGTSGCAAEREAFYDRAKVWQDAIPAAYPRFHDFYQEAGAMPSYGHVEDLSGQTYETTLSRALSSGRSIIQIVTWNDWGEGTVVEPSIEFGYRDLETTQRLRRKFVGALPYSASDLRLPVQLYELQKKNENDAGAQRRLNQATDLLFRGRLRDAKAILNGFHDRPSKTQT